MESEEQKIWCDARMKRIEDSINTIQNNHLAHMDQKINDLDDKVDCLDKKVAEVKTDTKWLVKFFWIVATAATGSLVAGLMGLILK